MQIGRLCSLLIKGHAMARALTVIAFFATFFGSKILLAEEISGKPVVIDARTMDVAGVRVRLFGIDAPDPGQPCHWPNKDIDCGHISMTALLDLVAASEVVCHPVRGAEPDQGIRLARCSADGSDVGANMVYTGWALPVPGDPGGYGLKAETARTRHHGMWKGTFEKPWIWRRLHDH